jgi:hypothetical protein
VENFVPATTADLEIIGVSTTAASDNSSSSSDMADMGGSSSSSSMAGMGGSMSAIKARLGWTSNRRRAFGIPTSTAAVTFGAGMATQDLNDALDPHGLFTMGAAHPVSNFQPKD